MAANIMPSLDRKPSDSEVSEEKQVGFTASLDLAAIDAPVELSAEHAAEYVHFLQLKTQFEADPKAYKKLIRRRLFGPPCISL